jgi:hypothetical protein
MSYSSQIADLLAAQLTKFATLNRHQLAGQVANLDFWLTEVRHCLAMLDGYRDRFHRMREAQESYVERKATVEFPRSMKLNDRESDHEGMKRPERLRPVNDKELQQSRVNLCDAAYGFLVRCCNEGLISESVLRASCGALGIGVESRDINKMDA